MVSKSSVVLSSGFIWRNGERPVVAAGSWACGKPRRVFQDLREQIGMSTPLHAALWILRELVTSYSSSSVSRIVASHSEQ
jgi:hypothetical protein